MYLWVIAFLLGILSLNGLKHFNFSIHALWFGALLLVAFAVLVYKTRLAFLQIALLFFCGALWMSFHVYLQLNNNINPNLEGKTAIVTGRILSPPEIDGRNTHFEFQADSFYYQSSLNIFPKHIRLSWYEADPGVMLLPGQRWQFQVRLKAPRSTFNPGDFDYEAWLFSRHMNAVGYILTGPENHFISQAIFYQAINRIRSNIDSVIKQHLQGDASQGLISALVVGVRTAITPAEWQVLQATGTNHLMAIAGLHIGFVAGFFSCLMAFLWRRFGKLPLYIPTPQAAAFTALIAAFSYSALAGFALPTQRAVIMLAVFLSATLLRKNLPAWCAWSLALFIVLIIDPISVLTDSFWLSFFAVAIIIYGVTGRTGFHSKLTQWGRLQWVVTLGLIPLTLLFFHQVSPVNLLANAIAIPCVGFIVLPLSLTGSLLALFMPTLGGALLVVAAKVLSLLWIVLQYFASLSALQWHVYITSPWILFSAILGILLLLAPRGLPGRWLGIFWCLPLVMWKPAAPAMGQVWLSLLDVGQGLSVVVRTHDHTLVYDTGAKFSDNFDMGSAVLVPYLREAGVHRVSSLIISHGDNDHIGGSTALINAMPVEKIITSVPERFSNAIFCERGQAWQWDQVKFQILYPPVGQRGLDNDNSCVLRISVGEQHILLTGDIERRSERELLEHDLDALPADILVAPHHGSRTSSTLAFVRAVHPHYVLFATGYRNRYHLPSVAVIARYQAINSVLLDSVHNGAMMFKLDGHSDLGLPLSYRVLAGHYWNA
jgi:competence protein ComEC